MISPSSNVNDEAASDATSTVIPSSPAGGDDFAAGDVELLAIFPLVLLSLRLDLASFKACCCSGVTYSGWIVVEWTLYLCRTALMRGAMVMKSELLETVICMEPTDLASSN